MKKILISIITLIFIISITVSVQAATTGKVEMTLSKETVKAGEEFSIVVAATDTNNLNTVEYSGITITDENGNNVEGITVKTVEAIGDNWAKMNAEGKTNFVYSGEATQTQQVFKVTFTVNDGVEEGAYKINIEGIKVSSTNLDDITTDIGTKTETVKVIIDKTTVGNQDDEDTEGDNTPAPEPTPSNPTDDGNSNGNVADSGNKEENKTKNVIKNTTKNITKNKTTKLPQTGSESASVIALIALGALAISSYISYRKYKNI